MKRRYHTKWICEAALPLLASALLCAFAPSVFAGETVTVDNVISLTNELDRLNRLNSANKKSRGDVIILKPRLYDVSGCHMFCDAAYNEYAVSTSHLAIAYVTLKGESDNPRDTVIYGNRTDRIFYMYLGKLQNVTVSNGCQTVGDRGGAGVCARNQGSELSNVVVTCCSAVQKGGGVYYAGCKDCIVESCHSDASGGGVYYCYGFYRGRIVNNTSGFSGGGASNADCIGTYIAGNTAVNEGGGLIYNVSGSSAGSTNCTIACNVAKIGGGVGNTTTLRDCTISNNIAVCGGGISECTAYDCKIVHNIARAVSGSDKPRGGGCFADAKNCKVYDSLVAGNACPLENSNMDRSGGAGEKAWFYNCRILNNFARVGASLNYGLAEDCIISNNVSPLFYLNLRGTTSLTRCKIFGESLTSPGALTDCTVTGYNGVWELPEGANVYTNGLFVNENTTSSTYGLFVNNINGTFALTNCLIHGNRAYHILSKDDTGVPVNVVNCTIVDNTNGCMTAGFRTDSAITPLYLKNTIICRNVQMANPANNWNFYPRYGSDLENNLYVENCIIGPGGKDNWGYQSCTGLISSNDPKFALYRDAAHPYSIRPGSVAIGKGTVEDWMADAYDIRYTADGGKYRRMRDGKVDIGCYQCWLDPKGTVMCVR